MALELVGKLIKTLPEVNGQSQKGPWQKQEFVVETLDAQFPKKVCLTAWGERVNDLKQFAEGDTIKAAFSPESREYNERWYTELRAFRIELAEGADSGAGAYAAPARQAAPAAKPAAMPASGFASFDSDENNDLPF